MRKKLKIAEISDVHVGNRRTPTSNTLQILEEAFPDNAKTGELDLIIIAGDFFDKALPLVTNTVGEIHVWVTKFIRMCAKWDIKIRILEGTPSHDRNQPVIFDWLSNSINCGADVKYMSGLQIEHIVDLDIDVLYIQDELTSSCEATQELVIKALNEKGLTKVDYTVMHGMFSHRIPKGVIADSHDARFYQSITRKYVFCGHIHVNARYGNILEAGSTDRISFNEEEDKGHWRVYEGDKEDKVFHVKHKLAWTYKAVDVCGMDYSQCIRELTKATKGLRPKSYIQLLADKTDDAFKSVKLIEEEFPAIIFKLKDAGLTEKMKITATEIKQLTIDVIELTPQNAESEIMAYMRDHTDISEKDQSRISSLLGEIEVR